LPPAQIPHRQRWLVAGGSLLLALLIGVLLVIISKNNVANQKQDWELHLDPEVVLPKTPTPPPWLPVAEQARVDQAVHRGVLYLQSCLAEDKAAEHIARSALNSSSGHGWPGLAGLALLHCDAPRNDPAIRKAAALVRSSVPQLLNTYEIAPCIWFLDRLKDPVDRTLIQTLAARLVVSQQADGGWPYFCSEVSENNQKTLLTALQGTGLPNPPPEGWGDLPVFKVRAGEKIQLGQAAKVTSNSLTLFGMLGLWVAQRHGVAAERSLALAEARFRASQAESGGWSYGTPGSSYYDSGTCAGLLALALGRGVSQTKQAPLIDDPAVAKALKFLSKTIGTSAVRAEPGSGHIIRADAWGDLFFLWALERMAMVYDLRRIEGKDWYVWGVQVLLPTQNPDGSWIETWPAHVDTCFALLFLRRANVAQDLTRKLQQ
jgi:hypothetical protein